MPLAESYIGISAWISEEYSRSKASLSPGTAPTRQRLDTVLVENQRNARKVIRPCIELVRFLSFTMALFESCDRQLL